MAAFLITGPQHMTAEKNSENSVYIWACAVSCCMACFACLQWVRQSACKRLRLCFTCHLWWKRPVGRISRAQLLSLSHYRPSASLANCDSNIGQGRCCNNSARKCWIHEDQNYCVVVNVWCLTWAYLVHTVLMFRCCFSRQLCFSSPKVNCNHSCWMLCQLNL